MHFRKIIVLAFLLFSAHFSIFSQKNLHIKELFGNELSAALESDLSEKGFSPIRQALSPTGQDNFAYNILLNFEGQEADEVIFCFMQEDFFSNEKAIFDFLYFLKNRSHKCTATVLFSALDKSEYESKNSIRGSQIFASSMDDTDSCSAIIINLNSDEDTAIYTGGKKNTSPLWLTRKVTENFFDSKINFSFENRLSAIYRLGIVQGQKRLSYFFENKIPALELNFKNSEDLFCLKKFADSYDSKGSEEWDNHYLYVNRGSLFKPLFIDERTIIISCLSVGILTILLLCIFSFLGEFGERHKYEFIRSSYMIPFTIGLSFLSLILGQHAVGFLSSFFQLNPIIQYGIKIVFSMSFLSLLFTVQGLLKLSLTAFMYGYILLVVAIFNIFLFSSRDLTLFVIFAAEYILIYLSRGAKSLPSLSVFFILMMLPFAPYGFIIIRSAEEAELTKTVFTTAGGNLILSLAIFPFQVTWLRMLVFLNVRAGLKGYTLKRMILNAIFSTIAILAFIFAVIFAISHFIYKPEIRAAQRIETKIERDERFTLSAKLTKDEFQGMATHHIRILSDEDALRYSIVLKGSENAHSIYDSIYNYTITTDSKGNDSYSFVIPDYPPRKITIDYAAPAKTKAEIEVTAFYKSDKPNTLRIEKRDLKVE